MHLNQNVVFNWILKCIFNSVLNGAQMLVYIEGNVDIRHTKLICKLAKDSCKMHRNVFWNCIFVLCFLKRALMIFHLQYYSLISSEYPAEDDVQTLRSNSSSSKKHPWNSQHAFNPAIQLSILYWSYSSVLISRHETSESDLMVRTLYVAERALMKLDSGSSGKCPPVWFN